MAHSPPKPGIKNVRDLFTRGDREKISLELKQALSLLQLSSLDSLEERFLATAAFLEPWAVFRDSIFLLHPDAMPRATTVARGEGEDGVSRSDLLWFYTQFDEGIRRYDPRGDKYSKEYTTDSSVYSVIDKSNWDVKAYEKHLFAWLLQVFKVGKSRNPWDFDYFELRNICTAWEAVFVPVLDAVRASYSVKGRRHYGRLALYIEERCPSSLAFPRGNVTVSEGSLMSPTPYRIVSIPKKFMGDEDAGMLTRKHYDDTEKELRDVYPQYGGLVERPKFKHKMEEWLNEQRARADLRKAAEITGEVKSFQPQMVKRGGSRRPMKKSSFAKYHYRRDKDGNESPIKRYSDNIRRSLSRGVARVASKEEPKSPLHGVTRQIHVPDGSLARRLSGAQDLSSAERHVSLGSIKSSDTTIITPWPRPDAERKPSGQSVFASIRDSNPFSLSDSPQTRQAHHDTDVEGSLPMGQTIAVPQPLHREHKRDILAAPRLLENKFYADARVPSYECSGWDDEISLTKLHTVRKNVAHDPQRIRPTKPVTILPVPIKPTAYAGNLRIRMKDGYPEEAPKPVAWPGTSPPHATAWPGMDECVPFVPSESPERQKNIRADVSSSRPQQLLRDESDRNITRIVSKENIRSALKGSSRDSSVEDLIPPPPVPMLLRQNMTMSPGSTRLQTYNTNLFPRREECKGTPKGEWVGAEKKRDASGGPYEMDTFSGSKNDQSVKNTTAGSDTRYRERYHGIHEPDDRRSFEKWI
ncbi:hypothetical protein G6011_04764 [Alternaria panax]|uniref:Uncharacterized protein n=1 Tax=Alternaria panax TaxID=48097 RepID=A0AAD4IHQ6_9PLEO|nr:hypothetical protein G6011_04764 [Alternaria panax]